MTLKQLLDAMNEAKAKAEAAPEDAALKTAYEAAKAAHDAKAAEEADDRTEEDESKWDEATKAYIARLRGENANHRTKNKDLKSKLSESEAKKKAILKAAGIEDDSENPEEKLKTAGAQNSELTFRNAMLEMALENGIPKEDVKYFSFLVQEATASLKDDEELSPEQMAGLVADVKKRSGGKAANTSVNGKGAGSGTPPPGGNDQVNLDGFCKMRFTEKSALYGKNPALYEQLMQEAKRTNRLV